MRGPMRDIPILGQAIADVLHALIEESARVHLVGASPAGAVGPLRDRLGLRLTVAEPFAPAPAPCDTVVALDAAHLESAVAAVAPRGTLIATVVNPHYGWFLLSALEGADVARPPAIDGDRVCADLERAGWEIVEATPVIVPLALLPFDPARIPKTLFEYLYARHPDLETYCVLLRARRATETPRPFRAGARPAPTDIPTMPWKTEREWREERTRWGGPPLATDAGVTAALEHTERTVNALRLDLMRREEELELITSSLTWRAIVAYRRVRERVLPPPTRRGRMYERVRVAVGRLSRGRRAGD